MSSLSTAFGTERIGSIVPGHFPGNKKYLPCDGVTESATVPANAHLGVLFPRISGAQPKQYTNGSLRDIRPTQMAFGNGVYVVVGPYSAQTWGMCLSSIDGKKWVRRELPANLNWTYVVWTGQYFIAAGGDNSAQSIVARSEDGTNWSTVYTTSSINVGGLWSAFGVTAVRFTDGTYAYTLDGLTWQTTSLNILPTKVETFKNVMYSAQGSQVYRSDNMINWEAWFNVTSNVDVASNGTVLFIASSSANASRYTTDGVNLVAVTVPGLKRVVWNGENFVAFGAGSVTTYYTSPDGINWTTRNLPVAFAALQDCVANTATKEVFFYMGINAPVVFKLNSDWTAEPVALVSSNYSIKTIVHTGTMWLMGGTHYSATAYPFIATSTDGINWTHREPWNTTTWGQGVGSFSIVGSTIVASLDGTQAVVRSTDGGLTWTYSNSRLPNNGSRTIVSNGTLFMAYLANNTTTYYTSTDGFTWTSRTAPTNIMGIGVCGDTFGYMYFDGSNSYFRTSTDGINWTAAPGLIGGQWVDLVGFKGTTWLIYQPGSTNGNIYSAAKNPTGGWTSRNLGNSPSASVSMFAGANQAMLFSQSGNLYSYSSDGITWTPATFENSSTTTWSVGAQHPTTGEILLVSSQGLRFMRTTNLTKWSFGATSLGDAIGITPASYIRGSDRIITGNSYKLDSDQIWRPMWIPSFLTDAASFIVGGNAAGNGFVACGITIASPNNRIHICYSTNGIEWTLAQMPTQVNAAARSGVKPTAIVHDGTAWYIFFNSFFSYRSTDGVTWTKNAVPFSIYNNRCIVYGNGKWVALPEVSYSTNPYTTSNSSLNDYYVSSDGINWTRYKNPIRGAIYVGWGPELGFMMINSGAAEIRTSTDGVTWSNAKNLNIGLWFNGTISYVYGVLYANGTYFIMSNVGVFMTKDGVMWSARYLTGSVNSGQSAAYVDGSGNFLYDMLTFSGNTLQNYVAKIETNVIRAPSYSPYPYNLNTYNYSLVIG